MTMFVLIVFLFVVVVINNSVKASDTNNQCNSEHVCESKDDAALREKVRCERIRDLLFHPTDEAKEARSQWRRILPLFMKTQLDHYEGEKGELEFPVSLQHQRFNLLGPLGPNCRTELEKYGKGDEEKRACGLSLLESLNTVQSTERKLDSKDEEDNGEDEEDEEEEDDEEDDDEDEDDEDANQKVHEEEIELKQRDGDCVVFSIGSNNQWQFEEAIVNQTSCRVETFDCTMDKRIRAPKALRHRVRLHHLCLSDREYNVSGRQYVTWHQILSRVGLTTAPTFLKMDIEGYEFPVMKSIIDAGIQLPLQISMEVHVIRHEFGVPQYQRRVSSMELHSFVHYLYEFGGYYLIDRHDNPFCITCSEVVFAKLDCDNHPLKSYDILIKNSERYLKKAVKKSLKQIYYN